MRGLSDQARALDAAMAELVMKYQFRDRGEVVGHGLSVSQAYALRALGGGQARTMGELAAWLGLSVSATTRAVDPLEERGLVARERSPEDRRVYRVRLTRKGRALWDRIHRSLVASQREVLRGLSAGERETLIEVMGRLAEAVERWRARQPR